MLMEPLFQTWQFYLTVNIINKLHPGFAFAFLHLDPIQVILHFLFKQLIMSL